jgi:hypothetical protein
MLFLLFITEILSFKTSGLAATGHTNPRPGVRIVALASCGKTCPLSGSVHRAR